MNSKKAGMLQIGVAILYTITILISSNILDGFAQKQSITLLLIGLWFMNSSLIITLTDKKYNLVKK